MTIIRFTAQRFDVLASEGEAPSRTIQGVAVPWGVTAHASTGKVRFAEGALPVDGPAPKLLRDHDPTQPIGIVLERVSTPEGMMFSAKISATAAGDEVLVLAADGVLDAVSVGAVPTDFEYDGDTMIVNAAEWRELSVLPFGAFDTARIHQVAAEAADQTDPAAEADEETETEPTQETEAPAVTEATIPTSPIVVAAPAITRPRINAAQAVSAIIRQDREVLDIMAADSYLAQIGGLLPEPLLDGVWDTQYAQRPLIDAVGTRAMPAGGESFFRRYVSAHSSVAAQAAEGDALSSQAYAVGKQQFDKKLYGGYVNVSAQSADFSDPALVQQILNDMVRQYSRATEAAVVAAVAAVASVASSVIVSPTDGDEVIAVLYDGAGEMFTNDGVMPDLLLVSQSFWSAFGQAKTATNDYIFPYLNPSNAAGQMTGGAAVMSGNPLGLRLVVSNNFADNAYLIYSPAIEVYEDRTNLGGVRVDNPSTATSTLGVWGYMAAGVMPADSSYILELT